MGECPEVDRSLECKDRANMLLQAEDDRSRILGGATLVSTGCASALAAIV